MRPSMRFAWCMLAGKCPGCARPCVPRRTTGAPEAFMQRADATALVSVVLPTFNRLQFLRAAVESVCAQTFTGWELLIADDGSGGETRGYLQSLAGDPRITVLYLAHSGRPSAARNAALRRARGEYVAFLD